MFGPYQWKVWGNAPKLATDLTISKLPLLEVGAKVLRSRHVEDCTNLIDWNPSPSGIIYCTSFVEGFTMDFYPTFYPFRQPENKASLNWIVWLCARRGSSLLPTYSHPLFLENVGSAHFVATLEYTRHHFTVRRDEAEWNLIKSLVLKDAAPAQGHSAWPADNLLSTARFRISHIPHGNHSTTHCQVFPTFTHPKELCLSLRLIPAP